MSYNDDVEAERIKKAVKLVALCPILSIKQVILASGFSKNPLANIACLMLSIGHSATNLTAFLIHSAFTASFSDILVDS